jgi:6-pyruvoyl-tetrahydropterin synthase
VRYTISVRETFSASHSSNLCGYGLHGHTFVAEVALEDEPSPAGNVGNYLDLSTRLRTVLAEANGRDLHDMLFPQLPEQLCVYLHERLAIFFPTITRVTVSTESISASVEFPLR